MNVRDFNEVYKGDCYFLEKKQGHFVNMKYHWQEYADENIQSIRYDIHTDVNNTPNVMVIVTIK